jgi:hypothetical protein
MFNVGNFVIDYVGFQILIVATMRSYLFWNITPCNPLKSTNVSEARVSSIFRTKE